MSSLLVQSRSTGTDGGSGREVRCAMPAEGQEGNIGVAVGYAAVFERFSVELWGFREKIRAGAFAAVLEDDVRALVNHDSNLVIGRRKAGTLRLQEDALGLRCEIDLPDTTVGRDTKEQIRRGDIDGMSFSFVTDKEEWDWSDEDNPVRTIVAVAELYDVGPVTFPAYTDTSIAMRAIEGRSREREGVIAAVCPRAVYEMRLRIAGAF